MKRYDASTHLLFFKHVHEHCPPEFKGVWWMKGNTFPMDLVCVHHLNWNASGTVAMRWDRRGTTRSATFAGMLLHVASTLSYTRIEVVNDRWIRTDGGILPPLNWLADSYWLYRISDDEMLRIVFDARGRVVWKYRMLRIARSERARTRFFDEYLKACEGKAFLVAA